MNEKDRFLSAQEAAAELGVTLATLYAYASRGMLRSEPVPGEPRAKRYPREDVLRLKERKELRRDPERAAPKALHWGAPVLESAITLVENNHLYYRGHDAVVLARTWSVEEVAALIWAGKRSAAADLFAGEAPLLPGFEIFDRDDLSPVERCQVAVPLAGALDLSGWDLRPRAVMRTGTRILRLLAATAAGIRSTSSSPIAAVLQSGWAPGRPEVAEALGAALILCADHELNVSAFTARCVASAAATPWDVVSAGLAALKGGKHGGYTQRVEALFREAGTAEAARETLAARLRRGEEIPGFGHTLYPDGDPRAAALLEIAAAMSQDSSAGELATSLIEAARELIGELPNLDFGLVTLARGLGLPERTPLALFSLGRSIGWIGHALEEYALDRLIRPRAAYVGEGPGEERGEPAGTLQET
ncbi:MAG TPA: citrate synthase family protein [Thermoanaerobaculia bacterium]|jgi:citrate synthase|nr:citrate synthase family protein [Thermoanaerobaculia bacterium]